MYQKQNFVKGQKLKADQLNHMEDGILASVSTESQDLTKEQMAQARGNIGAASIEQLDEVKTSVSEGKALIAAAVTGKGVETAANAPFAIIAAAVEKIEVGRNPVLQEKTVTPAMKAQVVTPDSEYDGLGQVTVEGDSNFYPRNIRHGVTIFGQKGQCPDGDKIINGTINEVISVVNEIRDQAFFGCEWLNSALFPEANIVGKSAFSGCIRLTSVMLPLVNSIGTQAFYKCSSLDNVDLPKAQSIPRNCFAYCENMRSLDCGQASSLESGAFLACSNLTHLILRYDGVVTLTSPTTLQGCYKLTGEIDETYNPNGFQGYVYVPQKYLDQYPSATNWSDSNVRFMGIESYTVDGTITGELDEAKMNAAVGGSGDGSGEIM